MILFLIIQIILFSLIFFKNGYERLKWYIIFILFVPPGVVLYQSGFLNRDPYKILMLILTILTLSQRGNIIKKEWQNFPFKKSLSFVFFCILMVGIADEKHSIFEKLYNSIFLFLENFIILFIAYELVNSNASLVKIFRLLFLIFGIMGVYGIAVYLFKSNPYIELISKTYGIRDITKDYISEADRSRTSSFLFHPHFYGLLLGIILSMIVFFMEYKILKISKAFLLSLLALCFINLLLTNSRTPFISFIIGMAIYYVLQLKSKTAIRTSLAILIIGSVLFQISFVREAVDNITDIVTTGGNKFSGSSVSMREEQLTASLVYFFKNPFLGNGIRYINDNLGWTADISKRGDTGDLRGFESYYFVLLIEQGLAGIISNLVLFGTMIVFFLNSYLKSKEFIKKFSALMLSIVIQYLVFILATGTIGSMPFFFLLIGISVKFIQLNIGNYLK